MHNKIRIIAEAGSNFDADLVKAKELIHAGAEAGADHIKFQLFSENSFDQLSVSEKAVFEQIKLNPDWLGILDEECKKLNVTFLASVFDSFLLAKYLKIKPAAIKIASSEVTNLSLLQNASASGCEMIISTGMSNFSDIELALEVCEAQGNENISLMQCTAVYPCPLEKLDLKTMQTLELMFGYPVGFSDHTETEYAACAAVGLGCQLFEKHFTLSKKGNGPDHHYAVEPYELKHYISTIKDVAGCMGSHRKILKGQERLEGRREGLYATKLLNVGEKLTLENTIFRRPAIGIRKNVSPAHFSMKVNKIIDVDSPINFKDVDFY